MQFAEAELPEVIVKVVRHESGSASLGWVLPPLLCRTVPAVHQKGGVGGLLAHAVRQERYAVERIGTCLGAGTARRRGQWVAPSPHSFHPFPLILIPTLDWGPAPSARA